MYFHPYHYGDAHSKKTGLWGDFNTDLKGKSEKTKTMRSITPSGFARAFKEVNP